MQCPLAPGQSKTYTFLCTQFGTSWYHSHFSAQYGDGVLGPIVIYGPATADYDVDLGAMPISDWYHDTAYQAAEIASLGGPPAADNGLINGTMLNPSGVGGAYNKVTLTQGKKYRLRLINTALDNHFKVSLDGHNLTVIQADFVPIVPYSTQWLFIGIGQRYDVIITANEPVSSYWFRADVQAACGANNNNFNSGYSPNYFFFLQIVLAPMSHVLSPEIH
jgi:FtsP/CotA-like multicopper oxidase with cupredoxin domain